MVEDPRYDAVGSSSLREQLFQKYIQTLAINAKAGQEDEETRRAREKKERAAASLQERERQVQGAKAQASRELQRSRVGAGKEEGEREFGSLLVQAIRDHDVSDSPVIMRGGVPR
jgi:transcription elongation regulator 1